MCRGYKLHNVTIFPRFSFLTGRVISTGLTDRQRLHGDQQHMVKVLYEPEAMFLNLFVNITEI